MSGLDTLQARRNNITRDFFCEIKDENHILHSLLSKREITSIDVRNLYPCKIPITMNSSCTLFNIVTNFRYFLF